MENFQVISNHNIAQVEENLATRQKLLRASKSFSPGEVIAPFSAGATFSEPNYLTVQTGDKRHISLSPEFLQYVNHSCSPNAFFDTTAMQFICVAPIKPGDEITFFYPSSEWDMAQSFKCHCGSANCLEVIKGAAYIPEDILHQYKLTDFIQRKLAVRRQTAA